MRRTAQLLRALRAPRRASSPRPRWWRRLDGARLEAMGVHAAAATGTGRLAVSEEECRDVLWSTTDGTLWHRLVVERGWTDDRYATWLGQMWASMLVADHDGLSADGSRSRLPLEDGHAAVLTTRANPRLASRRTRCRGLAPAAATRCRA